MYTSALVELIRSSSKETEYVLYGWMPSSPLTVAAKAAEPNERTNTKTKIIDTIFFFISKPPDNYNILKKSRASLPKTIGIAQKSSHFTDLLSPSKMV